MKLYNTLVNQLIENNTVSTMYGAAAVNNQQHAAGDNRPFEPARVVIGAKFKKKKNKNTSDQVMIPVFKRPRVESIVKVSK